MRVWSELARSDVAGLLVSLDHLVGDVHDRHNCLIHLHSLRRWGLLLYLYQKSSSFINFLGELRVVREEVLNLFKRQIDEHPSDLWGQRRSFEFGDKIENCIANRLLEVRVICLN